MMTRVAVAAVALTLLPAAAPATAVSVDVQIVGGLSWDSESWIEFCPDRGAYVALYATYSDGSMVPVFPAAAGMSHWVNAWETRAIPVVVPIGVCLTDVHAVASAEWFDPTVGWLASAPAREHCVVLAGASHPRRPAWGFVVGWSGIRSYGRGEKRTGEAAYASASGTESSIRSGGSGEPQ
jgi:hypothetical protein